MSEDRDPEATLDEWKEAMQAEHANAIENPDPGADHRIEGVAQVSYRVSDEYDADSDARDAVGERASRHRPVDSPPEPGGRSIKD